MAAAFSPSALSLAAFASADLAAAACFSASTLALSSRYASRCSLALARLAFPLCAAALCSAAASAAPVSGLARARHVQLLHGIGQQVDDLDIVHVRVHSFFFFLSPYRRCDSNPGCGPEAQDPDHRQMHHGPQEMAGKRRIATLDAAIIFFGGACFVWHAGVSGPFALLFFGPHSKKSASPRPAPRIEIRPFFRWHFPV
jgi:hypothetical protein